MFARLTKTERIMWTVAAAALPAVCAQAAVFGAAALVMLAAALAAAHAAECLCLRWRGLSLAAAADGSAAVAACVLAVALPPYAPWWLGAGAAAAAVTLAKHAYGGLGNNPFNPAMVGYALAFFAAPQYFGAWTAAADAVSSPTPLAAARLGGVAAVGGWWWLPAVAAAAGGALLLLLRYADWRLPLSFLAGAALLTGDDAAALMQLAAGGLVFAAFFVVTDPVTAAASRPGRWVYGFITGALAAWLRRHGAHADGIAFAILIGNAIAPACDLLTAKWRLPGGDG